MWWRLLLCFLIRVAVADQYAWKSGQEYTYEVGARTLAALHQIADQYTGVVLKAELKCRLKDSNSLSCKLRNPQVAEIHAQLPGGWESPLPEDKTRYEPLELGEKSFEVRFENGAISDIVVEKDLPTWQVNVVKSIVSQLQVDTRGEYGMKSRYNHKPEVKQAYATYKTMEGSVTGECEVLYDVGPLPDYVLQTKPELAPLPNLDGDGRMIDIVKSNNFSNCTKRVGYHFGITGSTDWEAGSNSMGNFLSRTSLSRIVISGSLDRYTIQSSVTTNKITVSPALHNGQKGMVVGRINVTLHSVHPASGSPDALLHPVHTGSLAYSYNLFEENTENETVSSFSTSSSSEEQQSHPDNHIHRSIRHAHERRHGEIHPANSDESSDSSSYWQQRSSLTFEAEDPMLPFFVGYGGRATERSNEAKPVSICKSLASQVGAELQNPSDIPRHITLEKFSHLTGMLRTMNLTQMQEATIDIYEPSSRCSGENDNESQSIKCSAWSVFRDAVAQAGTGSAFSTIRDWIVSKKVQGAEAAGLIAVLPSICRHPSTEYMNAFFQLATSRDVTQQAQLNSTAILAFTDLVRISQVNNVSAHNRYHVNSFGGLNVEKNPAIENEWIPHIARSLVDAFHKADSPRIQVYVRALGNIAHPRMISVLEPYLEGRRNTTDFQRLTMVLAMDKLAKLYPNQARTVLWKIYQNTGEPYQVRTAAVFQLMRTNPPANMLQRMAEFTNQDSSMQVNSAVRSAIESAAKLDGSDLSRNARAARYLLTAKNMGYQYSRRWLRDYSIKEMKLAYKLSLNWIGSQDSIVPRAIFGALNRNKGGFEMPTIDYSAAVSSVDDLLNVLHEQFESYDSHGGENINRDRTVKFSPRRLRTLLNIQSSSGEQLEGNILIKALQNNHFIAFDNNTIHQLPKLIVDAAASLKHGHKFNYTKLYSGNELSISFPTATGLSFVYTLRTPSLVQIGGEVRGDAYPETYHGSDKRISIPDAMNASADIHAVFSTKMIARMGFVNPTSNQHHMAGLDKNFQINLPLRAKIDLDLDKSSVQMKLEPVQRKKNYNLVHYSSWPYTAQSNVLNAEPVSEQKGYRSIRLRKPQENEWVYGQKSSGFALRFTAKSQQKPQQSAWAWVNKMLRTHDLFSPMAFILDEETIQQSNYNLYLDSQLSSNNAVLLSASYANYFKGMGGISETESGDTDDELSDSFTTAQKSSSQPKFSEHRQKEFLRTAASGIKDAYAQALELRAEFQGTNRAQYAAMIAMASSSVDSKSHVLFNYTHDSAEQKRYAICFAGQSLIPKIPNMDFQRAFDADPTSKYKADLNFGESCQHGGRVHMEGELTQSGKRGDYLRHTPMAKLCLQQMDDGNKILPACRNITARANFLNEGTVNLRYSGIPDHAKDMSVRAYRFARYLGYDKFYDNDVNPRRSEEGMIDFGFKASSHFNRVNVTIRTPEMDIKFAKIKINPWVRPFVALDPAQSVAERFGRKSLSGQYDPTCVIDGNQASTFDNTTYPVELGNCWHVVTTTVPDEEDDNDKGLNLVCRDTNAKQRECRMVLGETEIQMYPGSSQPFLKVNDRRVRLSQNEIYRYSKDGEIAFEANLSLENHLLISSETYGVRVLFDRVRVQLILSNEYRNKILGLCGTFTGESATDFTTPQNCILKNSKHFASTYALITEDNCQGSAKENSGKVQRDRCYRVPSF